MKSKLLSSFLFAAVILAVASTATATTMWYVNGVSGSDSNTCTSATTACKTIGHAISLAAWGDTIMVGATTYTENLTIGISLKMIGSGVATTIIDGGGVNTVVSIPNTSSNVTLSKLTIRNGSVWPHGGGIYNAGTLTINNGAISGNSSHGLKTAGSSGGGIYNAGTLTINSSTVSGNRAGGGSCNPNGSSCASGDGGGIENSGTLTINNSTVSLNQAAGGCLDYCVIPYGGGGGIGILNGGTLTINNSTLSGNSTGAYGGGIYNAGTASLQNSIVANSLLGGNCYGTLTSNGYNLSSDGTCNFSNTGDLNNTDPKLGPLQKNGGPTQTQALLSGSPAIDAGNPTGCTDSQGHPLKTDQRGRPRPDKEDTGGCDMGAFERQSD